MERNLSANQLGILATTWLSEDVTLTAFNMRFNNKNVTPDSQAVAELLYQGFLWEPRTWRGFWPMKTTRLGKQVISDCGYPKLILACIEAYYMYTAECLIKRLDVAELCAFLASENSYVRGYAVRRMRELADGTH